MAAQAICKEDPYNLCRLDAARLAKCSDSFARQWIPYEIARRFSVLAVSRTVRESRATISVAAPAEGAESVRRALRFMTDSEVEVVEVVKEVVDEAIFLAYSGDSARIADLLTAEDGSVQEDRETKILLSLLEYSIARGASDLYLVPRASGTYVKIRVQGELLTHSRPLGGSSLHSRLVRQLKSRSNLSTSPCAIPQDGSFRISVPGRTVPVRASFMPTLYGEKVVMRLMQRERKGSLHDLGLPRRVLSWVDSALHGSSGCVIISGPTGSGKTTTAYTCLQEVARRGRHVVAIEDPVEQCLDGVCQTPLNPGRGLTAEIAFKGMLRQDPEVLLLGEIRDGKSAELCIEAGLSGHLIITSMHGGTVLEVLARLRAFLPLSAPTLQSLQLIICQRLIPRLCQQCRVEVVPGATARRYRGFRPKGCRSCRGSGYDGYALITEALRLSEAVKRTLAREHLLSYHLFAEHAADYWSFRDSLATLQAQGQVSSVTPHGPRALP